MLASYKLLRQMVALPKDLELEELVDRLTFSGLEVEGVRTMAQGTGLTVGLITSSAPHPSSDHLHLLKVDCGGHGTLDIVCGAQNVRVGLKVIVALPGAVLPAKGITIKESVIAGYPSCGMCCSLSELGVDENLLSEAERAGIEELPPEFLTGDDQVLEALGLDDHILEINVLANRPDLLSMQGLAREVAALFEVELKLPPVDKITASPAYQVSSATDGCRAFRLLEVETDGQCLESPARLQHYLRALGYRPISLAVDIGNFMMAITGQPFHFYDLDKVETISHRHRFEVRDDLVGEFETLDAHRLQLVRGDLVVTDGQEPLCLAGVMGLERVSTTVKSTHFGIEAADFNYVKIRHTVARTGLSSDSASRFIKRVNPALAEEALSLLAAVYRMIDPSFRIVSYSSFDETNVPLAGIHFSLDRLNRRLGSDFSSAEAEKTFKRLRIARDGDLLFPPIDRPDLKEAADIDEEIFRYHSPERLNRCLAGLPVTRGYRDPQQRAVKKIRESLIAVGMLEILSYTLVSASVDRSYRIFNADRASARVANPMTLDHEFVRSDLTASMIGALEYNLARQKDDFALFETSSVDVEGKVECLLSIGLTGQFHEQGILARRPYDFYDLKGYVEKVITSAGFDLKRLTIKAEAPTFFHAGRAASFYLGKELIAVFGELSPLVSKRRLLVGEVALDRLLRQSGGATKFSSITIYPEVERDFCFVLDKRVSAGELLFTIRRSIGSELKSAAVFDVFPLGDKEQSVAVKAVFSSSEHTYSEVEIKALYDRVIKAVSERLNGRLR